jgi:hypothetical protein
MGFPRWLQTIAPADLDAQPCIEQDHRCESTTDKADNPMKGNIIFVHKADSAQAEGFVCVKDAKGDLHKIITTLAKLFSHGHVQRRNPHVARGGRGEAPHPDARSRIHGKVIACGAGAGYGAFPARSSTRKKGPWRATADLQAQG